MGWTIYHRRPADPRAELRRLVTWQDDNGQRRPLRDAMAKGAWYAAVEHIRPDGSRLVWAAVFLVKGGREWGYKDMDEGCGPCESHCPKAILDLLTPLADPEGRDKYAAQWRARCRANLAKPKPKPLRHGDLVRFAAPYNLPGGPCDLFQAVAIQRQGRSPLWRFRTPDGRYGPYRLSGWRTNLAADPPPAAAGELFTARASA